MDAVEAEQLSGGLTGFDHSVGHEQDAVAGVQIEPHFVVADLGQNAQRQGAGDANLLAVEVGRQVAGVGQHQFAVGAEPGRLAGGEALAAGEHAVERFEDSGRAALRGTAHGAHKHGDVHGGFEALAGHVAEDDQQATVFGGLDVEEVAAHFVGGIVDGIDFKARGLELLVGNHQLLHAAGGGQLAGDALLVVLHAQEAHEDDGDDGQDSSEVGDGGEVDGDGTGQQGERGVIGVAAPLAHAAGEDGLGDADHVQDEWNEQQAGLEVAALGGGDQGGEDEDQPGQEPENGKEDDGGQQQANHPTAAHEQKDRADPGQHRGGDAHQGDVPAAAQGEEGDEELEVEIGRDEHQLGEVAAYQRVSRRAELPASSTKPMGARISSWRASHRYSMWPFWVK